MGTSPLASALILLLGICAASGQGIPPGLPTLTTDKKTDGVALQQLKQDLEGAAELRRVYTYDRKGLCSTAPKSICAAAGTTRDSQTMLDLAVSPDLYSSLSKEDTGGHLPVSPAKDQSGCNTVAAFVVTGAAEAAVASVLRQDGSSIGLSEQDLFFCMPGSVPSNTCGGTWTLKAALDTLAAGQPVARSCLPYNPGTLERPALRASLCAKKCTTPDAAAARGKFGYVAIKDGHQAQQHIRRYGSVIAQIDYYDDLEKYTAMDNMAGVYQPGPGASLMRGKAAGHAVLLVGYDNTASPPFWIARNSWGTTWASSGTFKIAMNAAGVLANWNGAFGVTWTPTTPLPFPLALSPGPTTTSRGSGPCYSYKAGPKDSLSRVSWFSNIPVNMLLLDNLDVVSSLAPAGMTGKTLLLCGLPRVAPSKSLEGGRLASGEGDVAAEAQGVGTFGWVPGYINSAGSGPTPTIRSTNNTDPPLVNPPPPKPPLNLPLPRGVTGPGTSPINVPPTCSVPSTSEAGALLLLKSVIDKSGSALPGWQACAAAQLCSWPGVSCKGGKVVSVQLVARDGAGKPGALKSTLSGSLPAAAVLQPLTALTGIVLGDSPGLSGSLPADWGGLRQLQSLQIFNTSVSGPLPEGWGDLTSLLLLRLWGNQLSGPLPAGWSQFGGKLQVLDVSGNALTGPLPASWSLMTNLAYLNLAGNELEGVLPVEWWQLDDLQELDLGGNDKVSGSLPREWSRLSDLTHLRLAGCSIDGPLPADWSQLANLRQLLLFSNKLEGTLPSSWSQLGRLEELALSSNNLSGAVPGVWGPGMARMKKLALADNKGLLGCLPAPWKGRVVAPQGGPVDRSGTGITGFC